MLKHFLFNYTPPGPIRVMIGIDSPPSLFLFPSCVYNTLANMCPTTLVKEGRKEGGSLGIVTRNRGGNISRMRTPMWRGKVPISPPPL